MSKIGYAEGSSPKNNVFSFLEDHVARHPDRVCLRWVKRENMQAWGATGQGPMVHDDMTYAQLTHLVTHVAAGYRKLGIGEGDRVLVFVPMVPYLYVGMFALQMLGAIPVFLDTFVRYQQLGLVADLVKPKAFLSVEQAFALCEQMPSLGNIPIKICMGPAEKTYTARFEALCATPEAATHVPVEQEQTALITFTTGSSGVPKGADRSHRFLAAQHYAIDACLPYDEGDLDLPVFPIFSLNNIAAGVPTVLPAINVAQPADTDSHVLYHQITQEKITCMTLNPSLLAGLNRYCIEKGLKLPLLRRVAAGGAAVSRDTVVDFKAVAPQAELVVMYGSTEAEPMAHITDAEMLAYRSVSEDDPDLVDPGVNCGHFAHGLLSKFLKIVHGPITVSTADDWKRLEVPRGEVGEVVVSGEHVCRSYYNDDEAFRKTKIVDVDGRVWHRTGDLGRVDEAGNFWMVGRVHNVVVRDGAYLFPVQAEVLMKRQPFARLTAFLGVPDEKLGEKTVCVVAPHDAADLEKPETLAGWEKEIRRVLDKNRIPADQVIFRPDVPMDLRHRSKVEYGTLRAELQAEGLV